MKRALIPRVIWGVFAVNRYGGAVWMAWRRTRENARKEAKRYAKSNGKALRYVVWKFTGEQR